MLYNAEADTETMYLNATVLENVGAYYMSPDGVYVLLAYDMEPLWRHSFSHGI
jgi:hypothetical protein